MWIYDLDPECLLTLIETHQNIPQMAIFDLDNICAAIKTFSDLIATQQTWHGWKAYTPVSCRKERIKKASTLVAQTTFLKLERRVEISV